ncbi:hypothetical protein C8R47DRAFT_1033148 [Mycena vitilis]|nr:hypothetical protein C8R47DRAFT_1033148 [Mycena vitilis]
MSENVKNVPMENMGRPRDGRRGPVGIEFSFPDPDTTLPVELLINRAYPEQRGQHWAISWTVGDIPPHHKVHRVLHIVREIGCDHYTNWGPITRSFDPRDYEAVPVAELTLTQRVVLEQIAAKTEVCVPNGEWNCQDWVREVLAKAVAVKPDPKDGLENGLLSAAAYDAALSAAVG